MIELGVDVVVESAAGVASFISDEDYKAAEQHFLNAMSYGEDEDYNLGVVSIQKGDYAKALNYFKGIDCNHNIALTQFLSGNMNDALENLKCAPEGPKTNYMLAVYGARTNDDAMVFEYLGKAVAKCKHTKEKAKTDREFLEYFDNPEFKTLVE